jgi:hypothetical protein
MSTIKQKVKQVRQRSYLGKDFDSFREELTNYAKSYYSDQIKDVSETSVAGMFIDMAAYVGDVMSYYLDYQFNELDINTATDPNNIEKLIAKTGIKIGGASPATVDVDLYLVVPANTAGTGPDTVYLPKILVGSRFLSNSGVTFELLEDVDYAETDTQGSLIAKSTRYAVKRSLPTTSASIVTETFTIDDNFIPFRKITLTNKNVSEIISVTDIDGNTYYEVDSLTHDVVYKKQPNNTSDSSVVEDSLILVPAPRRFTSQNSRITGLTTITFGSGNASSLVKLHCRFMGQKILFQKFLWILIPSCRQEV